jgi:hypothetical protein
VEKTECLKTIKGGTAVPCPAERYKTGRGLYNILPVFISQKVCKYFRKLVTLLPYFSDTSDKDERHLGHPE